MPSESTPPESADVGNPEVAAEDADMDAPGGFIKALLLRERDGASDEEEPCCSEERDRSEEQPGRCSEAEPEAGPPEEEPEEGGASAEREPSEGQPGGGPEEGRGEAEEQPDGRPEGQQEARPQETQEGRADGPTAAQPQAAPGGDELVPSARELVVKDATLRQQRLSYAKHGLRDQDAAELRWPEESYGYQELDFSSNQLTDEGLRPILELCERCSELRVLKLFRNRIGDVGARLLANFFEQCSSLREVHLSHNRLTEKGIEELVAATQRSRNRPAGVPLWLRVEYNSVTDQRLLLRDLEARHGVCPRREACSQFRCSTGSKVHLPFLDMNRERQEKDHLRRDLGLRAADSPRTDLPRRLPELMPPRPPRLRDRSRDRGRSHDSRSARRGHRKEVKEDLRRDLGLRTGRELLPLRRARAGDRPHGSPSGKRGHRLEARSLTPQRRKEARSRSRCRRTRRREGSNPSHRCHSKPRPSVGGKRVKRTRRRTGSDASCHADGRDGSGHRRKRTSQRSGDAHGHRDRPGPPPVPQEPQLESKELQERLDRLLGRI